MAVINLTFKDIQDNLVNLRFGESRREDCKKWINHTYARIWSMADWHFKKVVASSMTITAGNQPNMPNDFARALTILRDDGVELQYVPPDEYEARYRYGITQSSYGVPVEYTVVNRAILIGPLSSSTKVYSLSYQRRMSYYTTGGNLTIGQMSADTDYPLWPAEHHFVLVYGAMAAGLREINDPTFGPLDQAFEQSLTDMMNELLPPDAPEPFQFGRDDGI